MLASTTKLIMELSKVSCSMPSGNPPGLLEEALMFSGPSLSTEEKNRIEHLSLDLNWLVKLLQQRFRSGSNTPLELQASLNQMLSQSIDSISRNTLNLLVLDILLEILDSPSE